MPLFYFGIGYYKPSKVINMFTWPTVIWPHPFSFLMWTIFKVFTEFVTTLFLFYVLVFWRQGMWNLSSRPGLNPHSLLWKAVLTTGQAGKSPGPHLLTAFLWSHSAPDTIALYWTPYTPTVLLPLGLYICF